jgi:hypothetical protein
LINLINTAVLRNVHLDPPTHWVGGKVDSVHLEKNTSQALSYITALSAKLGVLLIADDSGCDLLVFFGCGLLMSSECGLLGLESGTRGLKSEVRGLGSEVRNLESGVLDLG